jgi:hypothetical protein
MTLIVRVAGRDSEDELPTSTEHSDKEELARFLNRHGPYALMWIRLTSHEYVRYDQIVSVRVAGDGPESEASLHS